MARLILGFGLILTLAACVGGDRGLRDLRNTGNGPDEFQVLPVAPLAMPPTSALPTPTPGGGNRADPNPTADAVAVLGGNPGALVPGGVPAGDAALIAATSRNGVDPAIRQTLASEDAAFRNRRSRLRLFGLFGGRDRYFRAYARQALDAYAELERFRAAGVVTPTAPPRP